MSKLAAIQEGYISETDRSRICSFDYEIIDDKTKPLIHQSARFLFFQKGLGMIVIDGKSYKILPNTIIGITPWQISEITEVVSSLEIKKVIYDYHFINYTLKNNYTNDSEVTHLLNLLTSHPVIYLDTDDARKLNILFDNLHDELGLESLANYTAPKPLSNLFVSSKILEILIVCARIIQNSFDKKEKNDSFEFAQGQSILNYIYSHSASMLSLEKLSKVFFMSESSVAKYINDITGTSFVNLLNDIRIEKAIEYLVHTDLGLNDIASILGFVDSSHISKHFKNKTGISPIEYRKHYKKEDNNQYSKNVKEIAYKITDYLYKNYKSETLNATLVADKFNISVIEVNRALLYFTEKSFDKLLNYIRINKACELLISTNEQILYIALEVGYNNVKTFNLNFIKYKNMTPTNFRKSITLQTENGEIITNDKQEKE
ncbi:MAG: helix-turn-helix domain-containing protein [Bacillales bacterium]